MNAKPNKFRRVFSNVALFLFSVVLSFLLVEFGLRLYLYGGIAWEYSNLPPLIREPDPDTGWRLSPNQRAAEKSLDYRLLVTTNSSGLRDEEHIPEPTDGQYTIVLLGDSYMEAAHVTEDEGFHRLLEVELGEHVRVVNLGVGGFGTVQAWQMFNKYGVQYKPDLILLGFYVENDIYNNSAALSRVMWGDDNPRFFSAPYVSLDAHGVLELVPPQYERASTGFRKMMGSLNPKYYWLESMTESVTERVWKQALSSLRQHIHKPGDDMNIHLGAYCDKYDPALNVDSAMDEHDYRQAWQEAYQLTDQTLLSLNIDAKVAGARLAMFQVPSKLQAEPDYQAAQNKAYPSLTLDLEKPNRHFAKLCAEAQIPHYDLLPDFREQIASGQVLNYQVNDSHWNAAGHALAARRIAIWLKNSGLLTVPPELTRSKT